MIQPFRRVVMNQALGPPALNVKSFKSGRVANCRRSIDSIVQPSRNACLEHALQNTSRPVGARFLIAEAHQEEPTAGFQHGCQAGHVLLLIFVREAVEQAAVDRAVESFIPIGELQRILR